MANNIVLENVEQVRLLIKFLVYDIHVIYTKNRKFDRKERYFLQGKFIPSEEWYSVTELSPNLYHKCRQDSRFLETLGDMNTDKTPGLYYVGEK